MNQSTQLGHKKMHKDKSGNRKKKDKHQQQPQLIEIDQYGAGIGPNNESDQLDNQDEDELNYGNYLNQRSQMHFNGNGSGGQMQQ